MTDNSVLNYRHKKMAVNDMLINCKCGAKAKIYSRDNINAPELFKVYCQCQNDKCNRAFTVMVSFFEELRASELSQADQLAMLIKTLPDDEVTRLLEEQKNKAA